MACAEWLIETVRAPSAISREEAAAVGVAQVVEAADGLVRHLSRDAQLVVELGEVNRIRGDVFRQEF